MIDFWKVHAVVRRRIEPFLLRVLLVLSLIIFVAAAYATAKGYAVLFIQLACVLSFYAGLVAGFLTAEASYSLEALVLEKKQTGEEGETDG